MANKVETLWTQAVTARRIADEQFQEPGELKACEYLKGRAQAGIAFEASEFLRAHGYTAGGRRPKPRGLAAKVEAAVVARPVFNGIRVTAKGGGR